MRRLKRYGLPARDRAASSQSMDADFKAQRSSVASSLEASDSWRGAAAPHSGAPSTRTKDRPARPVTVEAASYSVLTSRPSTTGAGALPVEWNSVPLGPFSTSPNFAGDLLVASTTLSMNVPPENSNVV